jgi:hypothetical protein
LYANLHKQGKDNQSKTEKDRMNETGKTTVITTEIAFFTEKMKMPKEGIEPSPPCGDGILNPEQENYNSLLNNVLTENLKNDSSQNSSFILEAYHDLQVVVKSWPNLPEHIKAAIQALIQTCA